MRATDVVQRHAPHFLLPFDVIAAAAALLLPPTGSTRTVCAVHSSPPQCRTGRIHTATGYHIAGGVAGLSLPKAFGRERVEKTKRMIVLGAWPWAI